MNFKLIEPLKEFFKDEVRIIGKTLGLVDSIAFKHPFPGPGLGIRIIGQVTPERVKILQEADHIYIDELIKSGFIIKYGKHMQPYYPLK